MKTILLMISLSLFCSFNLLADCSASIEKLSKLSEQIGSLKSDEFFEEEIGAKQYLFYLRQQLTITQYELKKAVFEDCSLYNSK